MSEESKDPTIIADAVILKLYVIKRVNQDSIHCMDINNNSYVIKACINDIHNRIPNQQSYSIRKTNDLSLKNVQIFVSDNPYHVIKDLKNTTADIILFYPTNLDLFIPFFKKLNNKVSQLLVDHQKTLDYLCPKKQFFLVELLFGSGYFKRQIADQFDQFLQLGNYKGILAFEDHLKLEEDLSEKSLNQRSEIIHNKISDKFTIFVQNALKHKGIICRCMPFGLLFWVFIMKKSYISKSKSIPVGILYIFAWLYYAN